MADEKKPTKKTVPINDVDEPGKSAAPATSKPVLVTNRPIMKDPMVVDDNEKTTQDQTKQNQPVKSNGEATIKPLSNSPKSELINEPNPESPKDPQSDNETPKDNESKSNNQTTSDNVETTADDTKSSNNKADKKSSKTPGEEEEAEASRKAEREANLQKIVDNKTYFLPINAVEKRKTKRFIALGIILSLILAVAWVDVALDAGLIEISGVKPVTHFFSN